MSRNAAVRRAQRLPSMGPINWQIVYTISISFDRFDKVESISSTFGSEIERERNCIRVLSILCARHVHVQHFAFVIYNLHRVWVRYRLYTIRARTNTSDAAQRLIFTLNFSFSTVDDRFTQVLLLSCKCDCCVTSIKHEKWRLCCAAERRHKHYWNSKF